ARQPIVRRASVCSRKRPHCSRFSPGTGFDSTSRASSSRTARFARPSPIRARCRYGRPACVAPFVISDTRWTISSIGSRAYALRSGVRQPISGHGRPRARRTLHCRLDSIGIGLMAERKRPRRTRERILETALSLFNRLGEPNVTTADIAGEMEISPGNLYYHFRNKDEIVAELFAMFERRLDGLLTEPEGRHAGVEDLWLLLHLLFEAMWEHRFLFRDLDEILSRNRKLATRFALIMHRGSRTVIELCRSMVATGAMDASER